MDANWSSFIFQSESLPWGLVSLGPRGFQGGGFLQGSADRLVEEIVETPPPGPNPAESLQVELLPVLSTVNAAQESAAAAAAVAAISSPGAPGSIGDGSSQASTVDTEALKQGLPGNVGTVNQLDPQKRSKSKGPYICALCSKEFKNGYNLRRHEAIHTGVKPRSAAATAVAAATATTNKMPTMVPLNLLSVSSAVPLHNAVGAPGGGAVTTLVQVKTEPDEGGLITTTASGKRIRKNHACEMCGKAFRDVYHLNRHKLSHSDEKPYECPICQQRFKRKDRMSYHVRSHDGTIHKPYICSHCGKGFSRPDHLNSHVRQVHSSERPFKCMTCQAAFATKDRLRAHMVRHEEKVPCHICGKLLSAAYITDHMKVHSEGPQHVCDLCNKGFTTAAYLRVHAVRHHGLASPRPDSYLCKLCSVHCKTPTQLSGHLQTHLGQGLEGAAQASIAGGTSEAEPLR